MSTYFRTMSNGIRIRIRITISNSQSARRALWANSPQLMSYPERPYPSNP